MAKRIIIAVFLLIVAAGGGLAYYWHYSQNKDVLQFTGLVESQEVRLGSKLGGRVAAVKVAEGEVVEKNQILVQLAKPELDAQRLQAQAKAKAAEEAYLKAKNGPLPEEISAAEAAMGAAKARWDR